MSRWACFFYLDSTKSTEPILMGAPYRAVLLMLFQYFTFLFNSGQQLLQICFLLCTCWEKDMGVLNSLLYEWFYCIRILVWFFFFSLQSICKCSEEICLCGQMSVCGIFLMTCLPHINPVSLQGIQLGHLCLQGSGVLLQDSGTYWSLLHEGLHSSLGIFLFKFRYYIQDSLRIKEFMH